MAALAAFAIAGIRISHALQGGRERSFQIPVMGSTPAAEAAVLRALQTPPGFRRWRHCEATEACFVLRRSLPLNTATARRLAEALGVKIASSSARGSAVECGVLVRYLCRAEGLVGREHVWVYVDRPEVRNPKPRTRSNRRAYERFVVIPGTEIEVSVLGHCLHPEECAKTAHEEAEAHSDPLGKP